MSLRRVDPYGVDTEEPIVFSEWTFPFNDARMQRKDYTFAELLASEDKPKKKQEAQQSLFDLDEPDEEGIFLKQYISHYRRIQDADDL